MAKKKERNYLRVMALAVPEAHILTNETPDRDSKWTTESTHDELRQKNFIGLPVRYDHKLFLEGKVVDQCLVEGKGLWLMLEIPLRPASASNADTEKALRAMMVSMLVREGNLVGVSLSEGHNKIVDHAETGVIEIHKQTHAISLTEEPDREGARILSYHFAAEPYRSDGADLGEYDRDRNGSVGYVQVHPLPRADDKKDISGVRRPLPATAQKEKKTKETPTTEMDPMDEATQKVMEQKQKDAERIAKTNEELARRVAQLEKERKVDKAIVEEHRKMKHAQTEARNKEILAAFKSLQDQGLEDATTVVEDEDAGADDNTRAAATRMQEDIKRNNTVDAFDAPFLKALENPDVARALAPLIPAVTARNTFGRFALRSQRAAAAKAIQTKAAAAAEPSAPQMSLITPSQYRASLTAVEKADADFLAATNPSTYGLQDI